MKKTDLKVGMIVKCTQNKSYSSTCQKLVNIEDINNYEGRKYGTDYPRMLASDYVFYVCVDPGSSEAYEVRAPKFILLDDDGNKTHFLFSVADCNGIVQVDDVVLDAQSKVTPRQREAARMRLDAEKLDKEILNLKTKLEQLEDKRDKLISTAVAYEMYESDEQAIAAMLVEVLKTGANEEAITHILKKTGVTMRL